MYSPNDELSTSQKKLIKVLSSKTNNDSLKWRKEKNGFTCFDVSGNIEYIFTIHSFDDSMCIYNTLLMYPPTRLYKGNIICGRNIKVGQCCTRCVDDSLIYPGSLIGELLNLVKRKSK